MAISNGFSYDFVDGTYFICTHCNYAWKSRNENVIPRSCPKCGSRTWKNCCHHHCSNCGYEWMNSRETVVKCPKCQSRKWDASNTRPVTLLSEHDVNVIRGLYSRGHGAVRISRETGIPFCRVYEYLREEIPEETLRL